MKGKKVISALLCTAMAGTLLAGCGGSSTAASTATTSKAASSATTSTAASTATSKSTVADSDIKIGVSIWSSTDVLGSQCKKILDEAAAHEAAHCLNFLHTL